MGNGAMINLKGLRTLTCFTAILFGVVLPLILGVRDSELIAIIIAIFVGIYPILVLVTTFLTRPGLRIRTNRQNGVAIVRYDLRSSGQQQ